MRLSAKYPVNAKSLVLVFMLAFLSFPISYAQPIIDNDHDGIDDSFENALAIKFAPIVILPPVSADSTRPANVDWYLKNVSLFFHHANPLSCGASQKLLPTGSINQNNLYQQKYFHHKKTCGDGYYSGDERFEYFLKHQDGTVAKGIDDSMSNEWSTYVHVKKNNAESRYFDIQYWFFYPYNPFSELPNYDHEGDWEHITITVDNSGKFVSAYYAQHDGGKEYKQDKPIFERDHPVVYSAARSHASYPTSGQFPILHLPQTLRDVLTNNGIIDQKYLSDKTYNLKDGGVRWETWSNLINVGEKTYPLNGQSFLLYGGRWGSIKQPLGWAPALGFMDGIPGPAFQSAWEAR
jgi:hypothetical protein